MLPYLMAIITFIPEGRCPVKAVLSIQAVAAGSASKFRPQYVIYTLPRLYAATRVNRPQEV
jgi:hypothetical protein